MKSLPVSRARLADVLREVEQSRLPVRLTSHNFSVVVIGSNEWSALEQTLLRLSAPTFGRRRGPAAPRSSR